MVSGLFFIINDLLLIIRCFMLMYLLFLCVINVSMFVLRWRWIIYHLLPTVLFFYHCLGVPSCFLGAHLSSMLLKFNLMIQYQSNVVHD